MNKKLLMNNCAKVIDRNSEQCYYMSCRCAKTDFSADLFYMSDAEVLELADRQD